MIKDRRLFDDDDRECMYVMIYPHEQEVHMGFQPADCASCKMEANSVQEIILTMQLGNS